MEIADLTDEQLAGQRLMAGFDGTELNEDLKDLIGRLYAGGIILFSRNIVSPEQLRTLCESVQEYARSCHQPPLLIAIDQEGGPVARLKPPFTQFPGNAWIHTESDAEQFARVTAQELLSAGINMDMAPVLDVIPGGAESVMAGRAFPGGPEQVGRLGCRVIDIFQSAGVMAVAKHFPGIGRTVIDSHLDLPVMDAGTDDLEAVELPPFREAVGHGVAGVMLSHILYPRLDPDWPASLSPNVTAGLLREKIGYKGVVMTDDLDMGAVRNHYDIPTMIRQIMTADVDIALICHKGPRIAEAVEEMVRRVRDDRKLQERNRTSAARILALKQSYLQR